MSELKPCPFCGGNGEAVFEIDGTVTVECVRCGALADGIDAWNTRAVRTCVREKHGVKMDGSPRLRCSLCGYGIGDKRFNYCPSCGAEVIR